MIAAPPTTENLRLNRTKLTLWPINLPGFPCHFAFLLIEKVFSSAFRLHRSQLVIRYSFRPRVRHRCRSKTLRSQAAALVCKEDIGALMTPLPITLIEMTAAGGVGLCRGTARRGIDLRAGNPWE